MIYLAGFFRSASSPSRGNTSNSNAPALDRGVKGRQRVRPEHRLVSFWRGKGICWSDLQRSGRKRGAREVVVGMLLDH